MTSVNCRTSSTNLHEVDETMDEEIDIINCSDNSVGEMVDDKEQDGPEYSSSFGDTFSGSDNRLHCNDDVTEVHSSFNFPDGFDKVIKKKKVTAHWREYISPIMWRCLWLELRMKQLLSQIAEYDKELLAYQKAKGKQSNKIQLERCVSKSVPLTSQHYCRGIMQRRKRRRYEENVDIASYMPNHVIFSYYENKRTGADCHTVEHCDDSDENTNDNDIKCLLGSNDKSVEDIFLNIEAVQRRVIELKKRFNMAVYGNLTKKSSPDNLIVEPAAVVQNGDVSPRDNDDVMPAPPSNHVTRCESDAIRSDNEASSSQDNEASSSQDNEASSSEDTADVVQNLVRHLTAGLTMEEREALSRKSEENFLINNPVAEEVYWSFERLYQQTDQLSVATLRKDESHYGENTAFVVSTPKLGSVREDVNARQHEIPQPYCSSGGSKRVQKPNTLRQGGLKSDSIPSRITELNGHSLTRRMSGKFNDPNPLSLRSNDHLNGAIIDRSRSSRSEGHKRRKLVTKYS